MTNLEKTIGYVFKNPGLLKTALTHTSYANENPGMVNNERLEFLGDSLLGFLTARHLYLKYPDKPEGELTRIRAGYVCENSLADVAKRLSLNAELFMGRGEMRCCGYERPSIGSDALEALLAAIYFDGGMEEAKKFVETFVLCGNSGHVNEDSKTLLQEISQRIDKEAPIYRLVEESGPEHCKCFTVEVLIGNEVVGRGSGSSKKCAERKAARQALIEKYGET